MEWEGIKLTVTPLTTLLFKQQNQVNTVQKWHLYEHSQCRLRKVIQSLA